MLTLDTNYSYSCCAKYGSASMSSSGRYPVSVVTSYWYPRLTSFQNSPGILWYLSLHDKPPVKSPTYLWISQLHLAGDMAATIIAFSSIWLFHHVQLSYYLLTSTAWCNFHCSPLPETIASCFFVHDERAVQTVPQRSPR